MSGGVLIYSIALLQHPEILYVLPFQAYKLLIIHKGTGGVIYTYTWNEIFQKMSDNMFATGYEIISLYMSSLDLGEIKEIIFKKGTFLIQNIDSTDIYAVVFADKLSPSLLIGLRKFTIAIGKEYSKTTSSIQNIIQPIQQNNLVQLCFPYVPHRDLKSDYKL